MGRPGSDPTRDPPDRISHAIRPVFPGREALVAGAFGLIHGPAFSQTLRELDLTGGRLVFALLGFTLGIEAVQLIIVALVLPH